MTAATDTPAARAAHLRELAAAWATELRTMGRAPRARGQVAVGAELGNAIAGALAEARELDGRSAATSVEQQVAELRGAGLTFTAAAAVLGIPAGTAKTFARCTRLGGHVARL